ncbi:hypothetical protein PGT21_018101 [Puccinia graminis f. sp. tritici]|uniref:Uncharacterized protein n=1 Tax=Puccinia graminis f. sp. tritici TaxID=56615 RepID=A0A5B0N8A7_PUCGR|nr:hypothetical protein PGTUg99_000741 [Puccinia graminis f. sp. tritici]KAA1079641.1 hypothetical protein PGT21_018863 [Puccinia graminis f. sp. tritici]KAA1082877.1 hypothetical protein PGT21_018101 [Puccinia graminis f. sp. tritici]KAA1084952.1 hypothetical protein PGTUg99_004686 [Puccinia graminis f. sp. tritici]KAA1122621.1 hypothetical protein PGTUg99_000770 [Puccinia graminis f. sp. tritici]
MALSPTTSAIVIQASKSIIPEPRPNERQSMVQLLVDAIDQDCSSQKDFDGESINPLF